MSIETMQTAECKTANRAKRKVWGASGANYLVLDLDIGVVEWYVCGRFLELSIRSYDPIIKQQMQTKGWEPKFAVFRFQNCSL